MTSQKIKLLLLLCLLALLGSLGWLGFYVLESEQNRLQESRLIQKMEQERLALWRLDSFLASLWQEADTLSPAEFEITWLIDFSPSAEEDKSHLQPLGALVAAAFQFTPQESTQKNLVFQRHQPVKPSSSPHSPPTKPKLRSPHPQESLPSTLSTEIQAQLVTLLTPASSLPSSSPSPKKPSSFAPLKNNDVAEVTDAAFDSLALPSVAPSPLHPNAKNQELSQIDLSYKQTAEDLALRQNLQNTLATQRQDAPLLSVGKDAPSLSEKSSAKVASKKERKNTSLAKAKEEASPPPSPAPRAKLASSLEREVQRFEAQIDRFTEEQLAAYSPGQTEISRPPIDKELTLEEEAPAKAPTWVSPFKAYLLDSQIYLVRSLHTKEETYIQGFILENQSLATLLYSLIQESLPEAFFEEKKPSTPSLAPLTSGLALLPWNLNSGVLSPSSSSTLSSLPLSLSGAWLCILLALGGLSLLIYKLWELQERKSLFVSAVTHELRTPLTTFHLYSDLLEARLVPKEKIPHYFSILKKESKRLIHLVDNVLSYSKLEKSIPARALETLSVGDLAQRLRSLLEPLFLETSMDFVLFLDEKLAQKTLQTDPSVLEQVFYNLADNALKYAYQADSLITLSFQEKQGQLCLFFADQGKGICPEFQKKLFKPFSRSAEEAAGDKPGVGLGLALCQKLCQPLGAELILWQSSDKGSTFRLSLALQSESSTKKTTP